MKYLFMPEFNTRQIQKSNLSSYPKRTPVDALK